MLPAPLVSSWAFAGAVAAADSTGGAAVMAFGRRCGCYGCYGGGCQGGSAGAGAGTEAAAAAPTAAAGDSTRARGVIAVVAAGA